MLLERPFGRSEISPVSRIFELSVFPLAFEAAGLGGMPLLLAIMFLHDEKVGSVLVFVFFDFSSSKPMLP